METLDAISPLPDRSLDSNAYFQEAARFGLTAILGAKRASIGGALSLRVAGRCLPVADEVGGVAPSPRSCANGWIASLTLAIDAGAVRYPAFFGSGGVKRPSAAVQPPSTSR